MSESCTWPLNRALTGPILMVATALNPVSEVLLSSSHPGMHCLSTSASLSFAHTTSRGAASWTSPFIVIAIAPSPVKRMRCHPPRDSTYRLARIMKRPEPFGRCMTGSAGRRPMDESERYAKGMAVRRKVLGNAWVNRAEAGKTAFNDEFQAMINRSPWGEIWTRPHFDERTRRILVIGTMMALGCWDEFFLNLRPALGEGGFTPDDIKEIILQQTAYCGAPAGNHAFKEAGAIVASITGTGRARSEKNIINSVS